MEWLDSFFYYVSYSKSVFSNGNGQDGLWKSNRGDLGWVKCHFLNHG